MKLIVTNGYNKQKNDLNVLLKNKELVIQGDSNVKIFNYSEEIKIFYIGEILGISTSKNNIENMGK